MHYGDWVGKAVTVISSISSHTNCYERDLGGLLLFFAFAACVLFHRVVW